VTDGAEPQAAAWVTALTSRGVTLRTRGPRGLEMVPKSAYSAMSPAERLTLKSLKAEIVAVVRAQYDGLARGQVETATPPPDPVPQSRVAQADEHSKEEDAAEIRRKLGWNVGVMNEQRGYRYRE
jgi:hypothetical protein